jgi:predicted Zn-dependent protease
MISAPLRVLLLVAVISFTPSFAQPPASMQTDDPLLQAMQTEMARSKAQLKLEGMSSPYYIDYRVVDVDEYRAEAAYGALRSDTRTRFRFLRVVVRVGSYKQDSFFSQGEGVTQVMPLDDDIVAMRHQIWLATDRAYKDATEALTAKQAQLKQYTVDQPVDDFAAAEPLQSITPLTHLDIDAVPWRKTIQDVSALYATDPEIQSFDSSIYLQAVNRYFLNSEGTVIRSGQNLATLSIAATTQAVDGMELDRSPGYMVSDFKDLPTPKDLLARATNMVASLKELRAAPLVDEDYRGPVLFSGDASATVFADFVGENVLGVKPDLGQQARTKGAWASSYKTRVLPDFISVVDDPTLSSLNGKSLMGHYEFDDEGVKAARVPIVENGKLVNYLVGRTPIRDFPNSNGHGRARIPANNPGPSLGNLIVRSSETLSHDDLKKKFIELCQQRELPFGYYVETFGPRRTPRLLYKVWVKDGREELVRGAVLGDLDVRSMRNDVVAAGDDVYIENRTLNIPHSVVAPSILFDELEVKRANANKNKLPEYPAPAVATRK